MVYYVYNKLNQSGGSEIMLTMRYYNEYNTSNPVPANYVAANGLFCNTKKHNYTNSDNRFLHTS